MSKKKKITEDGKSSSNHEEKNITPDNIPASSDGANSSDDMQVVEEVKSIDEIMENKIDVSAKDGPISDGKEELENKLIELRAKYDELNDKYLRLYADFDNFRKRTIKERIEFITNANEEMIASLLPILDDFDRANKIVSEITDLPDGHAGIDAIKQGYELIFNKIKNIFSQKNLKEMELIGKPFDPELHEAVSQSPAPSEEMKGKIIDVVEKGYYINDKVIRHAKVVVGN